MGDGRIDIFGVCFDNLTIKEISEILLGRIKDSRKARTEAPKTGCVPKAGAAPEKAALTPFIVFTPNPEIVMTAQKDKSLAAALSAADLISADGIGIVWASKYLGGKGNKIKERASGYDIVQELFGAGAKGGGLSCFFLGGSQEVVNEAASKMEAAYPGLRVLGAINGYFSESRGIEIIGEINAACADLLLVGLGSPKQEVWVIENAPKLNAAVIIAVGGSFDVMSGRLRRAPALFRRFGLEWLYRLAKQPKRIFRMAKLPAFAVKVYIEYLRGAFRRKNVETKRRGIN